MIGAPPARDADGFAQRVLLISRYVVDLDEASSVHDHAAIGALRLSGVTDIAAANRHHDRDSARPLALLGIT
ncbi:hypothetical protein [Micromonospora radicis]|uniref:Uncharacterized protein n=1 Tax=Micromonospora radicis TaxID=1894971 RepID=A0A418MMK9_9ACTN|nr:hypothetical protein [Micromonospora radicis]RIV29817.1 hypothetical protein D2L64_26665 [Micromonospora radicis]